MQVLLSQGLGEDDLETELEEKLLDVDRMRTYDEGVNSVLVASAADEITSLRSHIDQQADEIEHLKDRWAVVSVPVCEAECIAYPRHAAVVWLGAVAAAAQSMLLVHASDGVSLSTFLGLSSPGIHWQWQARGWGGGGGAGGSAGLR